MASITPTFSILIPTYNGAKYIRPTIESILNQSFQDFEIIVNDDHSSDDTTAIISQYRDRRIKIYFNKENVGYPKNLERSRSHARGRYLFLLGQDDIVLPETLKQTLGAFKLSPDIGAVTRPYYWFFDDQNKPARHKVSFGLNQPKIIRITDQDADVIKVFDTLDQLSGLAYRRDLFTIPFHPDIFPCHIYPFAQIFKQHPIVYLPSYTIAVRITSSQTRFLSSIYDKSPIQSWVDMVENLKLPHYLITKFIAVNYVGLLQIKNYSKFSNLIREIYLLIKFRPANLLSLQFWFFSLGTIFLPSLILIPLVDWYKKFILSRLIKIS